MGIEAVGVPGREGATMLRWLVKSSVRGRFQTRRKSVLRNSTGEKVHQRALPLFISFGGRSLC